MCSLQWKGKVRHSTPHRPGHCHGTIYSHLFPCVCATEGWSCPCCSILRNAFKLHPLAARNISYGLVILCFEVFSSPIFFSCVWARQSSLSDNHDCNFCSCGDRLNVVQLQVELWHICVFIVRVRQFATDRTQFNATDRTQGSINITIQDSFDRFHRYIDSRVWFSIAYVNFLVHSFNYY